MLVFSKKDITQPCITQLCINFICIYQKKVVPLQPEILNYLE